MVSPQEGKELIIFFQQKQKAAFNLQKQKDMMERAFTGASWLHTPPPPALTCSLWGCCTGPFPPAPEPPLGEPEGRGGRRGRAGLVLPFPFAPQHDSLAPRRRSQLLSG